MPNRWFEVSRWRQPVELQQQMLAYRRALLTPAAKQYVLPDLAEYCGAVAPSSDDPYKAARAAGRRDVWLRIQAHLHLDDDDLYRLLRGEPIVKTERGVL